MIVRKPWRPQVPDELQSLFAEEGIEVLGVTAATPSREDEERYDRWLFKGYHGSMSFMERHREGKYRPDKIVPGARTIVFGAINYYQRRTPSASDPHHAGLVARYAWGRDYHKELGKRLKRIARKLGSRYPDETFRAFTDATPLAERHYGETAGIGFTGRNTLLINGELGSWFFLGEIVTTKYYPPGEAAGRHHGGCPTNCTRCIDVCPTGALLGPHRIDASKCISYLTIEHDGPIPEHLRPHMGSWIFGCDLCQEVCPLNVRAQVTDVSGFTTPIAGERVILRDILTMKEDEAFVERFAGSPLMRAGRRKMIRNALVAAGNLHAEDLVDLVQSIADGDDEMLAEHAQWALRHMGQSDAPVDGTT